MKKYIAGAVLSIGILISPAFTQAASLTSAQVQAILSLLSSFGADSATIVNVTTALTGAAPTTAVQRFCHNFDKDLTVGSKGDDVSALNQALSSSDVDTTGNSSNFSEDNAGDVVAFQAKYGIRQTGYVGPLTRAKLNALYRCFPQPTIENFSASPTYGPAPLLVSFNATASTDNGEVTIDFGDRQRSSFEKGLTHSYTSPGTYVAVLTQQPPFVCNAPEGAACAQMMPAQKIIGTVKINVTNSNPNSSAPVVNGIDGPASLNAGQTGTWTVRATVPNQPGAQLSYSVQWGDETYGSMPMASSMTRTSLQTSATFTHIYQNNDTYKPKFTVSNSAGSSSAEMVVTVGGQTSAVPSIHIITPNGGETLNAGSPTTVQWDASNIPATTYVGGSTQAQVSYKIGLKLINPNGDVVGYIPLSSNLFEGTAKNTQWDPASLNGGFSSLNQLKVRASVIKQRNQCVSTATAYPSLATSQTVCTNEETVASDDSDGWFSVKGVTVCNNTVTPMTCTASI